MDLNQEKENENPQTVTWQERAAGKTGPNQLKEVYGGNEK